MKITKEQLAKVVKDELKAIKDELRAASKMHKSQAERIEDIIKEESVESETHRNRVKQASGVLSSKMETLVDEAFFLADELDMGREEARAVFKQAAEELQNMQSPSGNPVTTMVIEKLKFLEQPGVLIDEIGDAIVAFDE